MSVPLAIYGSHDSSICIIDPKGRYRIYELERYTGIRNFSLNSISDAEFIDLMQSMYLMLQKDHGFTEYGSCFFAQLSIARREILKSIFGFTHFEEITHHAAHAAGALYQSDFEQAIVISSDSGGFEMPEGEVASFCIFFVDRTKPMNQVVKKLAALPLDVCGAYTTMAIPLKEIWKQDEFTKYLSYAGKIMGLAAYGDIKQEWVAAFEDFYYGKINLENLKSLGEKIGLDFSGINKVKAQDAYDVAATSQFVFEKITIQAITPFIKYYNLPVILTGGAGLNVLLNQTVRVEFGNEVFVPVNPNDCGLSFGMMALREPPAQTVNIAYNGFDILDIDKLPKFRKTFAGRDREVSTKEVARMIAAGKIIGVVRGSSECGARALGNRSILCSPAVKDMKDILNEKVKFREWFRPFAPVVKLEDAGKYFYFAGESPFMSYAATVVPEYRDKVPAIVHEDGTARLQTVGRSQNPFLHELIDAMETLTDIGMVLNTSFNSKGKPILTTIEEALELLNTTGLDAVLIENIIFEKS